MLDFRHHLHREVRHLLVGDHPVGGDHAAPPLRGDRRQRHEGHVADPHGQAAAARRGLPQVSEQTILRLSGNRINLKIFGLSYRIENY